ncbi:hypothetical protein CCOS865_01851 [Pseudomonas reidholzensis]|uniref:Uncharacterized protein n=1 Tax=Pseudomonas reidholzensis TaxID=1785162 RepID=A0A383RRC3_9PSED|nr:hypothetical protein [Pseudomonas reidholzensis]SYX89597.1 hypothetical protein CCOS865_01851 [Pseudomonas reidholzensis]
MRKSAIGDSIEGNALELQCRKFKMNGPTKSKFTKALVFNFKLSIHGFARISKPLGDTETQVSDKSMINVGDEIHGESINGFSSKPMGREEVKHATSTHKATFVSTRGKSYANVEIGVREFLQAIDNSNTLPNSL